MQVEIKIDANCKETKIIIVSSKMTEEINQIVKRLSEDTPQIISGIKGDMLEILDPKRIYRIYSADKKVFAITDQGEYTIRLRLYELEERLDTNDFVRISNSEIINIHKVKSFDLSFTGTICVSFTNGTITYVSRRYVKKIKEILGV